jgi:hypothetical protein
VEENLKNRLNSSHKNNSNNNKRINNNSKIKIKFKTIKPNSSLHRLLYNYKINQDIALD